MINTNDALTGRRRKSRSMSLRFEDDDEVLRHLDEFRRAQIATPSQTEALRALVRLGFQAWRARESQQEGVA